MLGATGPKDGGRQLDQAQPPGDVGMRRRHLGLLGQDVGLDQFEDPVSGGQGTDDGGGDADGWGYPIPITAPGVAPRSCTPGILQSARTPRLR